jgi:hypothetical protein
MAFSSHDKVTNCRISIRKPLVSSVFDVREFFEIGGLDARQAKVLDHDPLYKIQAPTSEWISGKRRGKMRSIKVPTIDIQPRAKTHQFTIRGCDGFLSNVVADDGDIFTHHLVKIGGVDALSVITI